MGTPNPSAEKASSAATSIRRRFSSASERMGRSPLTGAGAGSSSASAAPPRRPLPCFFTDSMPSQPKSVDKRKHGSVYWTSETELPLRLYRRPRHQVRRRDAQHSDHLERPPRQGD